MGRGGQPVRTQRKEWGGEAGTRPTAHLPALVMLISVVDLWNLAHKSLLTKMTLTPFLATDSLVFLYVVIMHPVSGCVLTDITSAV